MASIAVALNNSGALVTARLRRGGEERLLREAIALFRELDEQCGLSYALNNLGKIPADLFSEFEGKHSHELSSGDVKYHQGFSSDIKTAGGSVHLTLAFNPSHLEIVNPVVEGSLNHRTPGVIANR